LTAIEDSNVLTIWSEWSDVDSAEAYFESHSFQVFGGIRILLLQEPCIVYDHVSARFTRVIGE
jgi:hypothetical protein